MHTVPVTNAVESEVRDLLSAWEQALLSRDVPRIMAYYSNDVVAFDAIKQLQFVGRDAYGAHWAACMAMCTGPMIFEIHQLALNASADLAFCHFLTRCGGTDESGQQQSSWMRVTSCLRRIEGRWKIVHEHFSMPIDMESGKALFDATP